MEAETYTLQAALLSSQHAVCVCLCLCVSLCVCHHSGQATLDRQEQRWAGGDHSGLWICERE